MLVFRISRHGNRLRFLQKVPQRHDIVCVRDILRIRPMQDQRLTVARYFKVAVGFLRDLAKVLKHGMNLAPVQIVRDGMLKNSVVGAQVRAFEI